MNGTNQHTGLFAIILASTLASMATMCESTPPTLPADDGTSDSDVDSDSDADGDSDSDGDGDSSRPTDRGGDSGLMSAPACTSDCETFPSTPLIVGDLPDSVSELFGVPGNFDDSGLCIVEPHLGDFSGGNPGAVFPANWLRPRFRFVVDADSEDTYEIRLSAENEKHDLVVYTDKTTWTMSDTIWDRIRFVVLDSPITVTIRAVDRSSPGTPSGARGEFVIAPVRAGGKMVYWATNSSEVRPNTSKLVSLSVGETELLSALTIAEVGDRGIVDETGGRLRDGSETEVCDGCVACIGCHVATPDGKAVSFNDHWPWNIVLASVEDPEKEDAVDVGAVPNDISDGALTLLNQPWLGMQTFSLAHWNEDEKIMVATYADRETAGGLTVGWVSNIPYDDDGYVERLIWVDLQTDESFTMPESIDQVEGINQEIAAAEDSAWGYINLSGEPNSVAAPDWSSDGEVIVYTSAAVTQDGRLGEDNSEVDIHMVLYNDGKGGNVKDLGGASDPDYFEYYAGLSADDKLIAFNRAEDNAEMVYYRPDSEIFVVPLNDDPDTEPHRLAANDPVKCYQGESSPGVFNSWAKWSPFVESTSDDRWPPARDFYFLVFSSGRHYEGQFTVPPTEYSPPDTRSSQLYIATIVRDRASGTISSYPAIYIWNQERDWSNLTPAWDDFKTPAPVVK
jgi:Tol biopolymer transport system component